MNAREVVYRLVNMKSVAHTTLNPYGPGTVRIHLIPPKLCLKDASPSVVILNGQDIIPINLSWAILLDAFIEEVNKYEGKEITDNEMKIIVEKTLRKVKKIYPRTKPQKMKEDLLKIVNTERLVDSSADNARCRGDYFVNFTRRNKHIVTCKICPFAYTRVA